MTRRFFYLSFESEATCIDAAKLSFPYSEQVQAMTDTMLDIKSGDFIATEAMLIALNVPITPEVTAALGTYPVSIRVIRDEMWATGETVSQTLDGETFEVPVLEAAPGFRVNIKIQGDAQRLPVAVSILDDMLSAVIIPDATVRQQWPHIRKFSGATRP